VLLALTGCKNTAKLGDSDSTPPSIGLDALVAGVAHTAGGSGTSVTARAFPADTLDFVAHGQDPEGVRSSRIEGTVRVDCDPAISDTAGTLTVASDNTDPTSPAPGATIRTERYAQYSFADLARTAAISRCAGRRFLRATGDITAVAENYYGGSTRTGVIKLVWTQGVRRLKVATLNLASGYWPQVGNRSYPPNYLDGLAKLLEHADIATLQEVDVGTRRMNGVDQPAYLAAHSGLTYHAFGKDTDFDGGPVGVAIISRYPLYNVQAHPTPGGRQLYLEAHANVDGVEHTIFATHWDFGNHALPAKDQFVDLQTSAHPPVILGGDFNAGPGDTPFDLLHDGLRMAMMFDADDIAKHVEKSPDGDACAHALDHIFVQGPYDVSDVNACIPAGDVTDHHFVLATLDRND